MPSKHVVYSPKIFLMLSKFSRKNNVNNDVLWEKCRRMLFGRSKKNLSCYQTYFRGFFSFMCNQFLSKMWKIYATFTNSRRSQTRQSTSSLIRFLKTKKICTLFTSAMISVYFEMRQTSQIISTFTHVDVKSPDRTKIFLSSWIQIGQMLPLR